MLVIVVVGACIWYENDEVRSTYNIYIYIDNEDTNQRLNPTAGRLKFKWWNFKKYLNSVPYILRIWVFYLRLTLALWSHLGSEITWNRNKKIEKISTQGCILVLPDAVSGLYIQPQHYYVIDAQAIITIKDLQGFTKSISRHSHYSNPDTHLRLYKAAHVVIKLPSGFLIKNTSYFSLASNLHLLPPLFWNDDAVLSLKVIRNSTPDFLSKQSSLFQIRASTSTKS